MNLPLLILLLAAALPAAPAPQPLAVVFVTVEGGPAWTANQQTAALDDARAALAWLRDRGLDAPADVEVLPALTVERLDTWEWLRDSPRRLTLHVVANQGAPWLGVGPHGWGGAFVPPDRLVVLAEYAVISRQAVIAHELAHALTGLPDWPDCDVIDLMCSPGPAYAAGTLGCRTLDALGRPCERTYLPGVGNG